MGIIKCIQAALKLYWNFFEILLKVVYLQFQDEQTRNFNHETNPEPHVAQVPLQLLERAGGRAADLIWVELKRRF